MEDKKNQEFVVVDKRKFTSEGDLRPGEQSSPSPEAAPPPAPEPPAPQAVAPEAAEDAAQPEATEIPEPPTQAEQDAQRHAYGESGKKLDEMLNQAGMRKPEDYQVNFEKFVASLYMTALMQLGMIRQEGEPVRADIVGARNTVDTIAMLQEKTKGNLTTSEEHMLQNVLFELRMATVEITNAIARGPMPGTKPPSGGR